MLLSYNGFESILFWLLLIIGAAASVWGVWTIHREIRKNDAFRMKTDIRTDEVLYDTAVLRDLITAEPAGDEIDYSERIERMEGVMSEMIAAFNDTMAELQDLPAKTAKSLHSGISRYQGKLNKEEQTFVDGLDSLADQELMKSLPPFFQAVATEVAKQGNPTAIGWMRQWAARRPEVVAANTIHQAAAGNPQSQAGSSEIDNYIG